MSTTEERLRAALTARAEQVRAEDLAPISPVVQLRPRWQSPWALLATAAVVLLVLGVVVRSVGSDPRSDRIAPEPNPDAPRIELPADVGREWQADDLSTPAKLDLDGDGVKETVEFLAEKSRKFDGRTRLQSTLSTTGEETYGIADLGTTIGVSALPSVDADGDGDRELVLYYDDLEAVGGGGHPLVFDLRDGLLVQAAVEDPELLVRGEVPVAGGATEFYEMVRPHDYWIEDGRLFSARSVDAFASGNMTTMRPETYVMDAWEWELGEDDVLRPVEAGCRAQGPESFVVCTPGQVDTLPVVSPVSATTIGVGEQADYDNGGYRFTARLEAVADPSLVVEGDDGRTINHGLEVGDPQVNVQPPTGIFSDGASLVLTSASDPSYVQVLVQDGDRFRILEPVGEIDLSTDGGSRTWLTRNGALVTVVPGADDTWQGWQWVMVSRTEMAAFPSGTVCFDDVDAAVTKPC